MAIDDDANNWPGEDNGYHGNDKNLANRSHISAYY